MNETIHRLRLIHRDNNFETYSCFNLLLKRKTICRKYLSNHDKINDISKEYLCIKKLNLLNIPNIILAIEEIKSDAYYETEYYEDNLKSFIENKNTLSFKDFIYIFIELLYTIILFRKYNFKHYKFTSIDIGYKINVKSRTYIINDKKVTVNNVIQLLFIHFQNSIFEEYNVDDEYCDETDIYQLQNILTELMIIVNMKEEQSLLIQNIFDMFQNDNLKSDFLLPIINRLIDLI